MLSMNNQEIYFAHKELLSRLNSLPGIGYPDYVNMTRNFSHFVIAKIGPLGIKVFAVYGASKKCFQKLTT